MITQVGDFFLEVHVEATVEGHELYRAHDPEGVKRLVRERLAGELAHELLKLADFQMYREPHTLAHITRARVRVMTNTQYKNIKEVLTRAEANAKPTQLLQAKVGAGAELDLPSELEEV